MSHFLRLPLIVILFTSQASAFQKPGTLSAKKARTALFPAGAGKSADTLNIEAFGIHPGSGKDAVQAVQQALAACKSKQHPVLIFPKGRYDFWPRLSINKVYYESNTTAINPKYCPIWIGEFNNLTIDANGSDFIYHGREQPFTIDHSENITLKNINIDWDIPLTAQATVKDTSAGFIDLLIDSLSYPYTIEKEKLVFLGEDWKAPWWDCMEFESRSHRIVSQTGDQGVLGNHWEDYHAGIVGPGTVRLSYPFARKPAIGNILVLRHSERDHAGIFITGCKNIRLQNINLYQTAGLGILAQYSANLHYSHINVIPNPAKGRYFSGHDDGCHFSNCKGSIRVEHCRFAGLMDDPINVHGTAVQLIQRKSSTELLCRFMHEQSTGMEWAEKGDRIGLIDHQTMQTIATAIVESFSASNLTDFTLKFQQEIPGSFHVGDALENLSWTPDVTIRQSEFSVNRARGVLISTPGKVIIENNEFESSGSAILIAGDANQWFESGAVKDVLIQNNRFLDGCLTSLYQFCEAIISIEPEIPFLDSVHCFHRNIRIVNNEFHAFDFPVLYAKSVDGLRFTGNSITRSYRFKPFHPNHTMFSFLACRNVVLAKNHLIGDVLGKNIHLEKMERAQLTLNQPGLFMIRPIRFLKTL